MVNQQIQAARHYHEGTKHPGGALMNPLHRYTPDMRPLLFKLYQDRAPLSLPPIAPSKGTPALAAITDTASPAGGRQIPTLEILARLLHFSAGITKRLRFAWGEMEFRAAACTGALYHIEIYLACGDLPGLDAGVYHYNPQGSELIPLRQGDYRRVVQEATGSEEAIAHAPAILLYTDVFWRNAIKYQAREYRHAFWDSGTILSHTLSLAAGYGLPARLVAGFVDERVNQLLDLDTRREATMALVPVGYDPHPDLPSPPPLEPLALKTHPVAPYEGNLPAIQEIHQASSLTDPGEVAGWRGKPPQLSLPVPPDQLLPLAPSAETEISQDPLEEVIVRRGSTRQFARETITFPQLSTVLQRATGGIRADFLEPYGTTLYQVYLIVNAVDGLAPGAYVYHREQQALELLAEGDFRRTAGELGLGQALAADASANLFFLANLDPILERFGNRGYRAAQLDASIAAGKAYLAAYAQRFGASGLTFFDDAVIDFFSPHARGKSVLFLLLLGKKATRSS